VRKGVKALGDVREYRGALVVPLRDINGELQSLQFISAEGEKRFLSGGQMAGCFFAQAQAGEAKGVSVPLQITLKMEADLQGHGVSQGNIEKMKRADGQASGAYFGSKRCRVESWPARQSFKTSLA